MPAAHDADFHRFRWAMVLAQINIAVPGAPQPRNLSAPERNSLHSVMEQKGGLTKSELTQAVRQLTGGAPDNLDRLLALPDAERALVLDPVRLYCHRDPLLSVLWPALPARLQRRLRGQWRRGRALTVADVLAACGDARPAAEAALAQYLEAEAAKKKRAPDAPRSPDAPAGRVLRVERARGRAPHTREIMREAVAFVLATDRHPAEEGGPLYRSDAIREAQLRRALDEQTNNHLIRHRLKLLAGDDAAGPRALNGLFRDLADTYAGGAAYKKRAWINGTEARDFGLAVYGTLNTDPIPPSRCTVDATAIRQQIDGFGAGVAFLAASAANLAAIRQHMGFSSIGPDKVNQKRHVALL